MHLLLEQLFVVQGLLSSHCKTEVQEIQLEIAVYKQVLFKHLSFVQELLSLHCVTELHGVQLAIVLYKHLP
jgi:hypothetical protein